MYILQSKNLTGGCLAFCRETQWHVMVCSGYVDFRQDKDMSPDRHIVNYFQQVIRQKQENDCR